MLNRKLYTHLNFIFQYKTHGQHYIFTISELFCAPVMNSNVFGWCAIPKGNNTLYLQIQIIINTTITTTYLAVPPNLIEYRLSLSSWPWKYISSSSGTDAKWKYISFPLRLFFDPPPRPIIVSWFRNCNFQVLDWNGWKVTIFV